MSIEAAHSVIIRRPIAAVFAGLTRLDAWRAWRVDTVGARQTSAGPLDVGATFEHIFMTDARAVTLIGEIIAYEPPHTLAYRAIAGPLPLTCYYYTVEATAQGTRLAVRVDIGDDGTDLEVATAIAEAAPRELDALAALLHAECVEDAKPAAELVDRPVIS